MATSLLSRTATKSLCRTLNRHFQLSSSSVVQAIRSPHAFVSSPFDSTNFLYRNCRGMACAPNYELSSLNLDNRVPATVITGFLGSGKVSFFLLFLFFILSLFVSLLNVSSVYLMLEFFRKFLLSCSFLFFSCLFKKLFLIIVLLL